MADEVAARRQQRCAVDGHDYGNGNTFGICTRCGLGVRQVPPPPRVVIHLTRHIDTADLAATVGLCGARAGDTQTAAFEVVDTAGEAGFTRGSVHCSACLEAVKIPW